MHLARIKWLFEANVAKCVVVVFRNERTFDGEWFGGVSFCHILIMITIINFSYYNGHRDAH